MVDYRKTIALEVLECAIDAGDDYVIAICRKAINAINFGWEKYGNEREFNIIHEFWHEVVTQR